MIWYTYNYELSTIANLDAIIISLPNKLKEIVFQQTNFGTYLNYTKLGRSKAQWLEVVLTQIESITSDFSKIAESVRNAEAVMRIREEVQNRNFALIGNFKTEMIGICTKLNKMLTKFDQEITLSTISLVAADLLKISWIWANFFKQIRKIYPALSDMSAKLEVIEHIFSLAVSHFKDPNTVRKLKIKIFL